MITFSIACVDDEEKHRTVLSEYLNRIFQSHQYQCEIHTFSESESFFNSNVHQYDLIFLDVEMPGKNGIEIAKELRDSKIETPIIFVTNFTDYAINGYDVRASDYILKPLDYEGFQMKINRVLESVVKRKEEKIEVRDINRQILFLPIKKIAYVEVKGHNLEFYTPDGVYKVRSSLKAYEEKLLRFSFIRTSVYCLVNPEFIQSVTNDVLDLGFTTLHISRSKKKDVLEEMARFLGETF